MHSNKEYRRKGEKERKRDKQRERERGQREREREREREVHENITHKIKERAIVLSF